MSTRIPARVDDECRLVLRAPEQLKRLRGRDVWVSIHYQPAVGLRSNDSNRYLWGSVYAAIASETGNDPESIHLGLKREAVRVGVLEPEYIMLGDQLVETYPTTRTDSDTFNKYVNWVKDYALHRLGIVIPEAEE